MTQVTKAKCSLSTEASFIVEDRLSNLERTEKKDGKMYSCGIGKYWKKAGGQSKPQRATTTK